MTILHRLISKCAGLRIARTEMDWNLKKNKLIPLCFEKLLKPDFGLFFLRQNQMISSPRCSKSTSEHFQSDSL